MSGKKDGQPHGGGKQMSPQTADMLSKKQQAYQQSEQQHFPIPDKGQEARRVHTNGSTPRKSS